MEKASIVRWFILLLALLCAVQGVSAFEVTIEEINPDREILEPGESVSAHYVFSYKMLTTDSGYMDDERFEFSTGLDKPAWDFKIRSENYPDDIKFPTRGGRYQTLLEFEVGYSGEVQLDVQLRGTVPTTSTEKLEVVKIEHLRDKTVVDKYLMTRDVVSAAKAAGALEEQRQHLKKLEADMEANAVEGVDISEVQAKYIAARNALTSAESALTSTASAPPRPAEAISHIDTAKSNIDEAIKLLAEKAVAATGAAIESLGGMINYFVENRSMRSDPQVDAIITMNQSAFQSYNQAKGNLDAGNYAMALSNATYGLNTTNKALAEAKALEEQIGEGFSLSGNLLLYIGIGVAVVLIVVGVVLLRKRKRWDELG